MVYRPRTKEEIYTSLRDGLTQRIERLTNFVETSFNYVWTQSFSDRFRDNEVALLAAQLSGWVDYAGGPITQDDLDSLDITGVSPEEINEFMDDEDLDELVEIVGTKRSAGQQAVGQVTFTTVNSFTEIPAETPVSTQPDSSGNFFEYRTDSTVESPSGDTEVTANITAVEVGEEYNVGAEQITYLPSPPTGVQGVANAEAILGGTNEETNESLRQRAKNAIFDNSGGGTADGLVGFVRANTEDVSSVAIAEYPGGNETLETNSPSPGGPGDTTSTTPFADVIVEGGDTGDIEKSINEARPVAIQHNLVRPQLIEINIDIDVAGSNVSSSDIQSSIVSYIDGRGLGEDIYRDKIIQRALNAESQAENITNLTISVTNEQITYQSGTDVYVLKKGLEMETDGITEVSGEVSGNTTVFTKGTDYTDIDTDSDSSDDSIDWSIGGASPDDSSDFTVSYDISDDIPIDQYEKADTNSVSVNIV